MMVDFNADNEGLFEPRVTVVIPVYNGSDYVGEAIRSALAQTYENMEIIVVNDGSVDGGATDLAVEGYLDKIVYLKKENGGVSTALNMAIEHASGEYISWLSHDDLYTPNKIEAQVGFLRENNLRSVILYSDYNIINESGDLAREHKIPAPPSSRFQYFITMASHVHGCTLLIPKRCFKEVGYFDESLRTTQDYMLWFEFAEKFEFIHMPLSLVNFRIHDSQGTRTMSSLVKAECDYMHSKFFLRLLETGAYDMRTYNFCKKCERSFRNRGYLSAAGLARKKAFMSLFWLV